MKQNYQTPTRRRKHFNFSVLDESLLTKNFELRKPRFRFSTKRNDRVIYDKYFYLDNLIVMNLFYLLL